MSYDLMVFEPSAAPSGRQPFMEWYRQQTEWGEGHDYNDPAVSTPALKAWFLDIIQSFPPLNGPLSSADLPEDEDSVTDYSIGRSVVYCGFAWSKPGTAHKKVVELAQKHGVGFFDVSSNGAEVWLTKDGKLSLAHRE